MKKRIIWGAALMLGMLSPTMAQRTMDKTDRGLVAVPGRSGGNHVSWRKFGQEYYDTRYNLYRDGAKIAGPLSVSNFEDTGGSANSIYQVEAVVNGVNRGKSASVKAWNRNFLSIPIRPALNREGKDVTSGYSLNDISLADVNGDGVQELMIKRRNDSGNLRLTSNKTDFNRYEVYDIKGNLLWWIDLGPNMMAGPDEQWDMIGYDWDGDGKAEALLRGADNMIIHTADGSTINIGDMTFDNGGGGTERSEYTKEGKEYLLYINGETGVPYGYNGTSGAFTPMEYPLPRFEAGETDYAKVWGSADTGHRAMKHYFGAPYLNGRNASIFLGRGCYTRHKMCALDVDPVTHNITQRWRWNTYDSSSPWFGNGFHNFQIADVDMDGRDEIVFGSMIIDDNGHGLVTTGLGHGDAQHCADLDPFRWGLEQFNCLEGSQGASYWNATTGQMYYRKADGGDDGRALAGNFTNDYPGGQGRTVSSGIIGLSSDQVLPVDAQAKMKWDDLNFRIYWDGDLLDEIFDSPGIERAASITKWGNGRIFTSAGQLNNSSKNNPGALGDILGDWREEFIVRNGPSELLLYTTDFHTDHDIYTLWEDHEYRNAMAWQCVGYNQPPHPSFFLGEMEGITVAPPPVTLTERTVVADGGTIGTTKDHLLLCEQGNMTVNVADGASPWIVTVNAPIVVQGTGADNEGSKTPAINYIPYTHRLTGGAFTGATRVVKQGEGVLIMPNVVETYTGNTDVWNGTLRFDGTLTASPLWLNRHTRLVSDGGKFNAGVQANYNASIFPGAENAIGDITVSQLNMKIGSRIVFDMSGSGNDKVTAGKLILETKDWGEYGPKYKNPVFEFKADGTLPSGKYEIATVETLEGNIEDIIIEGMGDSRAFLTREGSKIYLNVEALRAPADVVWNGTDMSNVWDFGATKNFLNNGIPDYSVAGDNITFGDDAMATTVNIKSGVRPASLLFVNETKDYVLTGDSIVSDATLTKNGAGTLTIETRNRTGSTTINGGTVAVNMLANVAGIDYGALGDATRTITINNGAALKANRTIITDHPITIGGRGVLETPTGVSLTLNKGLAGAGAEVVKAGAGTLSLGVGNTISKLVIKGGTVNAVETGNRLQLPPTVEFVNGVLSDAATENTNSVNATNFVVDEGNRGTLYGDPRCDYTGTLTGKGTFTVYDSWVRCAFKGDWSNFEGTVIPQLSNRSAKKLYDNTEFNFSNSYGLPKATLNVPASVAVNNDGKDFRVGNVLGAGKLIGTGAWIVGTNNRDISFGVEAASKVVKEGTGTMRLWLANKIQGQLVVNEGTLAFALSTSTTAVGSTLAVNRNARLTATGMVTSLTLNDNAYFSAVSPSNADKGGIFKTGAMFLMGKNTTADFVINAKNGTTVSNSQVQCGNFLYLGHVNVRLADGYSPAVGDSICLWTCTRVMQAPSSVTLPELPAGMAWDSTALTNNSTAGYLKIVATTGISELPFDEDAIVEVFTMSGIKVGQFKSARAGLARQLKALGFGSGTYIVRSASGSGKIMVK